MRPHPLALALIALAGSAWGAAAAPWPAPRPVAPVPVLQPLGPPADATIDASGAGPRCGSSVEAVMEMLSAHARRLEPDVLPTPNSRDVDEIAVLEDDGTFFYTNSGNVPVLDIAALCRAFYRTHGDDYDQLAVYLASGMTQWLGSPTALAAAWLLRNDTQGLGLSLYDVGQSCASPSRLSQVLTMNSLSRYLPDPDESLYGPDDPLSTMDVIEHEFAHRWLAYTWVDSAGATVPALLGRDWQHWGFFFDSDSSVMEGCNWSMPAPDSFRTDGAYASLGALDQYLMGLRARAEVGPFFVVNEPSDFDPPGLYGPTHYPSPGVGCRGRATWWTLDDIERVHGPRVPDAALAPHDWRVGFVLVVPHDSTASAADLAELQVIRTRFPLKFATDTEGRGSVDVSLDSHAGRVRIAHTPLPDVEDGGPLRAVGARVDIDPGGIPLAVDPGSVRLHWLTEPVVASGEIVLSPVAPDSFAAELPPMPQGTVRYWLSAQSDSAGIGALLPASGAAAPFAFAVGPDLVPPTLLHAPVRFAGRERMPQTLLARVRDNVGLDSVWFEYSVDGGSVLSVPAQRTGADSFAVTVGSGMGEGHRLAYRFVARDASNAGHLAYSRIDFDTLRVVHDWFEDFENPAWGYAHGAYLWSWRDSWRLEEGASSPPGGTAWHCGQPAGVPYDPHLDAILLTPYVYAVTPGTTIAFDTRHELEQRNAASAFDGARIELQVGTGAWQVVEPTPGYTHAMAFGGMPFASGSPCWSGSSPAWTTRTLDLTPWAPGPLRLRFRMCSDDLVGDGGLWVDRLRVRFPDDAGVGVEPGPVAIRAGVAWPNPTQGELHLTLALPRAARIEWSLLDVQGRHVADLWRGVAPAGSRELTGRASRALPPGLYFSRVLADGRAIATRRVALTR